MIFDSVSNYKQYEGLNAGIGRILEEAQKITPESFPKERLVFDGDALFMNFAQYETRDISDSKMEAHRKYADVMYVVEGSETVYVKSVDRLSCITKEYDPSIDALLAHIDGDVSAIRLTPGHFLVLFPQDAHAPGCIADSKSSVKKIIGKVLL